VALHLILALLLYDPTPFVGGDNARYMILGESLRSLRGFRDLHLPGMPVHTKYPPLYPALLAILGWFGGLQLFKLASLALTASTVWLTYLLARRYVTEGAAVACAWLIALTPVLLEYSHFVLSEAPFTFFTLGAVLLLENETPRRRRLGLLLAVLAFLTRTAGLALLAAIVLDQVLRKEWRRAVWVFAAAFVPMVGWAMFQHLAGHGTPTYVSELVLVDPYLPSAGTVSLSGWIQRLAHNAWFYVSAGLPDALGVGGGRGMETLGAGPLLLGIAATGLILTGWFREASRRSTPGLLFVALYALMIGLWPPAWSDRRFLLPLLPVALPLGVAALAALARRSLRGSRGREAVAVVAALLLYGAPGLPGTLRRVPRRVACLQSFRAGKPCVDPALASFFRAARWASENLPADAIVANRKPEFFYLASHHRGDVYRFSEATDLVLQSLDDMRADYVVVDYLSLTTDLYLLPAIRDHMDRFTEVYAGGKPETLILHYRRPHRTAALPGGAP